MSAGLTVRRSSRPISLTALIDVVFILLMFFMLTSSFDRFGYFEFNTPASSGVASQESQSVVLMANGDLVQRLGSGSQVLSDTDLLSRIDALKPLSVLPVGDANVQTMVQSIERLNQLGLANVTLGHVLASTQDAR
ncbi:ExbD/TolR family protein [Granulosicoccus antarcticus]|uniref:Biopolymer transport protein ExbD n=1 Tax=Granulosicoccus antarcticus IMCC3135 TaxID=1192854 RepID=A0A2Z2NXL3_9GAMM|nr:biopolymer transporter ExbD [Granulosicoccus antarcticus]ASJ75215.1 hypothetical protein IMCC3135_25800 [Granulosicoccus antarcticus IMCC3135]